MRLCVRVCLDGLSKLFIYGCLETVRQAALSPPPTPGPLGLYDALPVDEEGGITVCSPGPAVAASDGEDLPMRCIFIRATS